MKKQKIVCVDDENYIIESIKDYLEPAYDVIVFDNPMEALDSLSKVKTDVLIVDYRMPGINGLELLGRADEMGAYSCGILLTAYADKDLLKELLNNDLVEFVLEKPLDLKILEKEIGICMKRVILKQEYEIESLRINEIYRLLSADDFDFNFIGREGDLKQLWHKAVTVAPTEENVLITGDTGTGKDVLARQIHVKSRRAEAPFIKINCGAIPAALIESELFGYEKGAFSGAERRKLGKIELAHHGTLFLDEIGELPPELQSKLLHVVEDKAFERVGGTEQIITDFRLISATNRSLEVLDESKFRRDLFYRISTVHINLPPLNLRKHDFPVHVLSLIDKIAKGYRKTPPGVSPEVMNLLSRYSWPGNIRELDNELKRIILLKPESAPSLTTADFIHLSGKREAQAGVERLVADTADLLLTEKIGIREFESALFHQLLERCGGRVMEAHRLSGVPKDRFYRLAGKK